MWVFLRICFFFFVFEEPFELFYEQISCPSKARGIHPWWATLDVVDCLITCLLCGHILDCSTAGNSVKEESAFKVRYQLLHGSCCRGFGFHYNCWRWCCKENPSVCSFWTSAWHKRRVRSQGGINILPLNGSRHLWLLYLLSLCIMFMRQWR